MVPAVPVRAACNCLEPAGDDLARFVVLDCRPDREIARKQPPNRAGPILTA
jgi:hypothetical protein